MSERSIVIGGKDDVLEASNASVTITGQAVPTLPISNLATQPLGQLARTPVAPLRPAGDTGPFRARRSVGWTPKGVGEFHTRPPAEVFGYAGLFGCARRISGAGCAVESYRVRVLSGPGAGPNENPLIGIPVSVSAMTNLTGTLADVVSDPDGKNDALSLDATVPSADTAVLITFDNNPTAFAPLELSTGQEFRVLVRATSGTPTVRLDLYEAGFLVSTGLTAWTIPPAWTVVTREWAAALLSSGSATGIGCRVVGTAGGGGTIEVGGAVWLAEHASGSYDVDSGELVPEEPADLGEAGATNFTLDYIPPANVAFSGSVAYGRRAQFDVKYQYPRGSVATTYFEAGRMIVSSAFSPAIGISFGWDMCWDDPSTIRESRSGQERADVLPKRRLLNVSMPELSETEGYTRLFDELDRRKGKTGNFVVAIKPDDGSGQRQNQTLYCRQRELTKITHLNFAQFSKDLDLIELL